MNSMLAGAAVAVFTVAFSGAAAAATVCASDCNKTYSQCNATNGANGQTVCMPSWMQCKKACSSPAKTPTKVAAVMSKPKT